MKLYLPLTILFLVSCGTTEGIVSTEDPYGPVEAKEMKSLPDLNGGQDKEPLESKSYSVGVVHVSVERASCPLFIETKDSAGIKTLFPLDLEDRFKIDGTVIKFDYAIYRGQQPDSCSTDHVVKVFDVSLMKRSEIIE